MQHPTEIDHPAPHITALLPNEDPNLLYQQDKTLRLIRETINNLSYKDWFFSYRPLCTATGGGFLLRVGFTAPERGTGEPSLQYGRWWYVSPYSVGNEIVQTCLKAVLTAEEHEARETFRYKGRPVFGPHLDTDALASIPVQVRKSPMTRNEEIVAETARLQRKHNTSMANP